MSKEFEISMVGELTFFLSLQIKQLKEGIFVNQGKYVCELLKKYKLDNAKHASTPIASSAKLDQDPEGKLINEKLYRGMIGSLLYLTASRPDIMFSMCLCAHFQSSPKESHLTATKCIFFDTWRVQKISVYGILKGEISFLLNILTPIMQDIR